jgi:hypothetical protein
MDVEDGNGGECFIILWSCRDLFSFNLNWHSITFSDIDT